MLVTAQVSALLFWACRNAKVVDGDLDEHVALMKALRAKIAEDRFTDGEIALDKSTWRYAEKVLTQHGGSGWPGELAESVPSAKALVKGALEAAKP